MKNKKIIILTDGKNVTAKLFDGKNIVKEGIAKCSPKDDFDFEAGAKNRV